MRKDLKDPIDVNPIMANLSLAKFKKWHEKWLPNDKLTAEQRYEKIKPKDEKKDDEPSGKAKK